MDEFCKKCGMPNDQHMHDCSFRSVSELDKNLKAIDGSLQQLTIYLLNLELDNNDIRKRRNLW